jgi:two-component system sensor histidine kinase YesM
VREELRNLDQYLLLQKERLGKKFDYIIDADEEVMNDYIRKLIIQPFVENSILHGFANMDSRGLLQIKVKRFREDGLAIIVQDNGHGLRIQQLEQIRETFSMHKPPETMGIGIENVVYRVNRYYDEPKLFINSSAATGTRIVMILPALKK